jgi:3-deoxy-manno-octulosonate cytidylyltransferase (CMP-KDO synthetase)
MTPETCENGTERCYAALVLRKEIPDIVINLQGDAVLTPPHVIDALIKSLEQGVHLEIATIASRISIAHYEKLLRQKSTGQSGGTLVTFAQDGKALYFSKSIIPHVRGLTKYKDDNMLLPVFRHIGLYGYRWNALAKLVSLKPSPLEQVEGLEQLRALENGMHIQVVEVDYGGRTHWAVDSPEDAKLVEKIILAEGELVAAE